MTPLTRRRVAAGLALAPGLFGPARALAAAIDAPPLPFTWDLTPLYASDAAWAAACARTEAAVAELTSRPPGLSAGGASTLAAALVARSDGRRAVLRLGAYAQLKADADLGSAPDQDRRARSETLAGKLEEASVALDAAVRALGRAAVFAAVDGRPELARFRYGLERLFRTGDHTPTPAAAGVLAAAHPLLASPEDIHHQIVAATPTPNVRLADGRAVALTAPGARPDRRRRERRRADLLSVAQGAVPGRVLLPDDHEDGAGAGDPRESLGRRRRHG